MSIEGNMYLEDLCNEVLLETLEYLDAYQLFTTFYGLNRRFTDLIKQCHLHLCFQNSIAERNIWNLIASTINLSKVREISYYHDYFIDDRFLSSKCFNLRSLTIYHMDGFLIQIILNDIPLINQIKHIRIEYPKFLRFSNESPLNDFPLKKYHRQFASLATCLSDVPINSLITVDIPMIFPKLRRISLNEEYWRKNILEFLQNNTPNLRSLYIRTETYTPYHISLSKYVFKNITDLDINLNIYSIHIVYLAKMFPCLRRLHIQWDIIRKCPFIDGFQWEKVFEKHWPLIKHLSFDFRCAELNEQVLDSFYKNKYWISKTLDPAVWKIDSYPNHILTICF